MTEIKAVKLRAPLKNLLRTPIAALDEAHALAYRRDSSRSLGSRRSVLGPLAAVFRGAFLLALALVLDLAWASKPPVFVQSAEQVIAEARSAIARGKGQKARALLQPLARQGHLDAQYWLGRLYFYDVPGVPRNYRRAAQYWRQAARAGHADAQYKLGGLYFAGRGVKQDDGQAVRWWLAAARQRQPEALNNLGALLANGRSLAADPVLAYALQALAFELGNPLAAENLRSKEESLPPEALAVARALAATLREQGELERQLDTLLNSQP